MAVLPKGSFAEATVPLAKLLGLCFLTSDVGTDVTLRAQLAEHGIPVGTAPLGTTAILSMVRHGLGVSILSELSLHKEREGVLCLATEPALERQIGIAIAEKKKPSEAMRRLIQAARRYAECLATED